MCVVTPHFPIDRRPPGWSWWLAWSGLSGAARRESADRVLAEDLCASRASPRTSSLPSTASIRPRTRPHPEVET
jgi:hypothetical protein